MVGLISRLRTTSKILFFIGASKFFTHEFQFSLNAVVKVLHPDRMFLFLWHLRTQPRIDVASEQEVNPNHWQVFALNHAGDIQVWTDNEYCAFLECPLHPRLVGLCVASPANNLIAPASDFLGQGSTNT